MKIFYRASSFLSSNPNPMGAYKDGILMPCLNSFLAVFPNTQHEITFILDGVTDEVASWFSPLGEVLRTDLGNIGTFQKQLDLVSQLPDGEKVFLVEDDYLWRPNAKKIEDALDKLQIIFPYDHPGHYTEPRFRDEPKLMRLIDNQTYRDAPSNTLTFATTAYVIKQNLNHLKAFKIRDHEMFQSLKGLQYNMWCAVPAMATHLATGLLAPNVDWEI
jgi:hypothetical protein